MDYAKLINLDSETEIKNINLSTDEINNIIKNNYIFLAKLYILENRPIIQTIDLFRSKNKKIYNKTIKHFKYHATKANIEYCFDLLNNYTNYSNLYGELLSYDDTQSWNDIGSIISEIDNKILLDIYNKNSFECKNIILENLETIIDTLNLDCYNFLKNKFSDLKFHIEINENLGIVNEAILVGISNNYFVQCLDIDDIETSDDHREYLPSIENLLKMHDDLEYLTNYISITYMSVGLYDIPETCNLKIVNDSKEEICIKSNRKLSVDTDKLVVYY